MRPEKAELRLGRAELRPGRTNLSREGGPTDERTDGQTDAQKSSAESRILGDHSAAQMTMERISPFSGEEQPRTSDEMVKVGILRPGSCIGISGHHSLEFWPVTIVTLVPCTLIVLHVVIKNISKKIVVYS